MRFLEPLGLLGLIGIPVLILIYIIKNKHTEQTIASTYLWRLSERFLKRKNPISKLKGLMTLLLQCLTVLVISLAIAHPVLVMENKAYEYCLVLDASGSMQTQTDGVTRFDRAKKEAESIINKAKNGSVYSIYCAGSSTVAAIEQTEDKKAALAELDKLTCSFTPDDNDGALEAAQRLFDANRGLKTYFFTDKAYPETATISVVNLAADEENYALTSLEYTYADGNLSVQGKVISYASNASLTVSVSDANGILGESSVNVTVGEETAFAFEKTYEEGEDGPIGYVRARLTNGDSNACDDERIVYHLSNEDAYRMLLVSEQPTFFRSAILSLGYAAEMVDVLNANEYKAQYESVGVTATGYGMYLFDGFSPERLPQDGTVWLVNPTQPSEGAGLASQGEITLERDGQLTYSTASSSLVKTLLADLTKSPVTVKKYQKYGTRQITTLLSYQGAPMVFTGTTDYGTREIVFAFDLHDSNFPLMSDFVLLMRNLLDYSFPNVLTETAFVCGETVSVGVEAGCVSLRVDSPTQQTTYLDTATAVSEMRLDEVGTYTITATVAGTTKVFHLYSAFSAEEGETAAETEQTIALVGEPDGSSFDGKYDNLIWVFLALSLLFLGDWAVYCYDKYQLR